MILFSYGLQPKQIMHTSGRAIAFLTSKIFTILATAKYPRLWPQCYFLCQCQISMIKTLNYICLSVLCSIWSVAIAATVAAAAAAAAKAAEAAAAAANAAAAIETYYL